MSRAHGSQLPPSFKPVVAGKKDKEAVATPKPKEAAVKP
jgi:hypothetical protein